MVLVLGILDSGEQKRHLRYLMLLLPKPNRDTVEAVFSFFRWFSDLRLFDSERSVYYDMGELSVIFSSFFLVTPLKRPPPGTATIVDTMTLLLNNQDEFFRVPQNFVPMIEYFGYFMDDDNLPPPSSKCLLARIESFLQANSLLQNCSASFSTLAISGISTRGRESTSSLDRLNFRERATRLETWSDDDASSIYSYDTK